MIESPDRDAVGAFFVFHIPSELKVHDSYRQTIFLTVILGLDPRIQAQAFRGGTWGQQHGEDAAEAFF
ncbi:hypothetical protein A6U85_22395 [Agrobacterium sp. 13-626]|uniref:hypothetical protein n=1 Tax=Rhizobium rhizogenes TaxID=359 RepID=UPI0004D5F0A9|nr:hypothetical protein [Rhizobium rhizogenes]KEA05809.1 hypothetical protein CN09_02180 [Rhizobium rhizogenes]MQB32394.1 hypothetical protein [Rhizobium rhizogenes]NTG54696.1 hypothetical protein [Rhizobium rhizogenes]OCI92216.1 hypothetical protein A6U85_22395 [Agrobacterium sp. 13-626]